MAGIGIGIGLVRRTNPLPVFSNDSVATGWTTVNTTLAAAGVNDPESGVGATSMLETAADNQHYITKNISMVQGRTYRLRVVVKTNQRPAITLLVGDTSSKYWYGVVGGTTAMLSSGLTNAQVTDLGVGFYAQSVEFTLAAASGNKAVSIGISLQPVDTSYPGDVAKGLILGSVKLYEVA